MRNFIVQIHRKLTISSKIFLITFLLVNALVLSIGFFYLKSTTNALLHAQTEYAQQLTQKSNAYLDLNLKNIQSFFLSIANDAKLNKDSYEHFNEWFKENLILYIPNAKNIHLFENNEVVASSSHAGWLLEEDEEFQKQVFSIAELDKIYWSNSYVSSVSGHTVTAIMKIKSLSGKDLHLVLDLDFPRLYKSLSPEDVSSLHGDLLLLDYRNQPLYGSDTFLSYDSFQRSYEFKQVDESIFRKRWVMIEAQYNNKDYMLIRSQDNVVSWQVVWLINKQVLYEPIKEYYNYFWLFIVLSLLLSVVIAHRLSILIGRPIRVLAKSMDLIGDGNWNTKVHIDRQDELGALAYHFNKMTDKIKRLIDELKKTEEEKKEADFQALQTQIRPHFMFNTLNSISIAAREKQLEKVDSLISAFTETIHYSLEGSPSLVPLKKEMHAIISYIHLMQIRYDQKFTTETDIDPYTTNLLLPKFTLQPIVENSIFHGLVPDQKNGTLFIGTEVGDKTWDIIIEDTGIGLTSEKMDELLENLNAENKKDYHHIGLWNVHHRLKLVFGERYHFQIKSNNVSGTRIVLTLPIISESGGMMND